MSDNTVHGVEVLHKTLSWQDIGRYPEQSMRVTTYKKRKGKGTTRRCESAVSLHRERIAEEETTAKVEKSAVMANRSRSDKV